MYDDCKIDGGDWCCLFNCGALRAGKCDRVDKKFTKYLIDRHQGLRTETK